MPNKNLTYISFDFGFKKMGIAVGQTLTKTATSLPKIKMQAGKPNWDQINKLIQQWQPAGFVVGIPVNMDGSEQFTTDAAKKFAASLSTKYQLPVFHIDERLSTAEAKSIVFDSGGFKALKETDIDSIAAKLLLEAWLREHA
jgi:putative Holliday junction resolvase